MLEEVKQAMDRAQQQARNAAKKLYAFQNNFTGEEFKQLFILRAELAMMEHRTPGQFVVDTATKKHST